MNALIHLLYKIVNEIYLRSPRLLSRYFRKTQKGADEICIPGLLDQTLEKLTQEREERVTQITQMLCKRC